MASLVEDPNCDIESKLWKGVPYHVTITNGVGLPIIYDVMVRRRVPKEVIDDEMVYTVQFVEDILNGANIQFRCGWGDTVSEYSIDVVDDYLNRIR